LALKLPIYDRITSITLKDVTKETIEWKVADEHGAARLLEMLSSTLRKNSQLIMFIEENRFSQSWHDHCY
jgi:hypothetical protein